MKNYSEMIPLVGKAGYKNLICFSGNRNGMDDETGFKGYVAQEFIPTAPDRLASLAKAVELCDV